MHIKFKAARIWQLAFSLTLIVVFASCEDPASIGGEYAKKTVVKVDTLLIDNLQISTADAYLGKLSRSASGNFDDGLYGTINAFSFLKVPVEAAVSDTLVLTDSTLFELELRMYEAEAYGDTSTTSSFTIHRVTEQWRGSTYRKSNTLSYDTGEVIGTFSEADIDSNGVIKVPLTGSWKQDYISYFNSDAADRDIVYQQNEFGLAIVPDAGNQKISYFNLAGTDLEITASDDFSVDVYDWGYDYDRSATVTDPDKIKLSSTLEQYYTMNLQRFADSLSSRNIAKAEMIFNRDSAAINNSLSDTEIRSLGFEMGIKIGPLEDQAYELGFGRIDISGFSSGDEYTFDMTAAFNNYFYAGEDISELYVFLASTQGLLSFTQLFSPGADEALAPRLVIFSLVEEQ